MTNAISDTESQVLLVLLGQLWWSELWNEVMDGGVSPLPFGEEGEELSDPVDDSEYIVSNQPEEEVGEPVAFSVVQCHGNLLRFKINYKLNDMPSFINQSFHQRYYNSNLN